MRFVSVFIFFLLCSCSSEPEKSANTDSVAAVQTPAFNPGTITDYSCASNGSNQYSVYLPKNYSKEKKWPVLFFFDAHGNGRLPIEKYQPLADRWGYIFVGSNSSRNGMKAEATVQIGNELIEDVKKVFSVNENEILLCGFSGGARVASNLTAVRFDIKGLICNSAAPPAPLTNQVFIGIAGLGDMNYLEMKKFVTGQNSNKRPHELLVFDGKHEWAPMPVMEDALLMAGAYDFASNGVKSDTAMTNAIAKNILMQSDSIRKTSCLLSRNLLQCGNDMLQNGAPNEAIKKALAAVAANPCVASDEKAWKKAEESETALQQELANALLEKDSAWWQTNAASFFETKADGPEKFMRERLRGYMSLMCYSYCNQAFHINNLHAAEKMTNLYSIIDPENSEWAYMRAMFYAKIGLMNYVIPSLNKAVELGFSERSRLQNDPTFASLRTDPAFNELLGKIK